MPWKVQYRFRLPVGLTRPQHLCSPAAGQVVVADESGLWHIDLKGGKAVTRFAPMPTPGGGPHMSPADWPALVPHGVAPSIAADFSTFQVLVASRFGQIAGWDLRGGMTVAFQAQHSLPRTLCFDAGISVLYVGCGDYPLGGPSTAGAWLEAWNYRAGSFEFACATLLPGVSLDGVVRHHSNDFDGLVCFSGHASQDFGFLSVVDRVSLRVVQQIEVPIAGLQALAAKDDRAYVGAGDRVVSVSLADGSVRWQMPNVGGRFAFDDDHGLYLPHGEIISIDRGTVLGRFRVPVRCHHLLLEAAWTLIGVGEHELVAWTDEPMTDADYIDPELFPETTQSGLSLERQQIIDAFNHDALAELIDQQQPLSEDQRRRWVELREKVRYRFGK